MSEMHILVKPHNRFAFSDHYDQNEHIFSSYWLIWLKHMGLFYEILRAHQTYGLIKVGFQSRGLSGVPDFYLTFVKKSTLKSTLLDF